MALYEFQHPKTGKIFEEFRLMKDSDKPFIAPDGVKCPRIFPSSGSFRIEGREGFELDPTFYKKMNPKYVKYRDGHRERFSPNKHC